MLPRSEPIRSKKKKDKKRKKSSAEERNTVRKKKTKEVALNDSEEEMLNSDSFPVEKRPQMFQDDRLFNRLPFEKAAQICWDHEQMENKKELKSKSKHAAEKADDKLPVVKVSEGEDNAGDKIHEGSRKL